MNELDEKIFEDWWLKKFGNNDTVLALKPFAKEAYVAGIIWGVVRPKEKLSDGEL